ncbi:TonB-dependent receptor [Pasteurellaceae bacterium LIM206]|nr:TonB-dependent receptor [Pasteurellaceae bacterium LIM206]
MKIHYVIPLAAATFAAQANTVDLASAENYKMQFNFAPPPIITPQTDLTTPIENQFNYVSPWLRASVAQDVSSNARLLQINTQFNQYSNLQRALLRYRGGNHYVIAQAYRLDMNDYRDGNGDKVNAGYLRNGQLLMLGYLPTIHQEYRIGVIHDRIDDDKQPQHQMDSAYTRRIVLNGMVRLGEQDQTNTFNLNVRHIRLDRRANNFEVRTLTMPQKVQVQVEREILNVETDYRLTYGNHHSQFGVKYDNDTHNAERFAILPRGTFRNAYRFPDIKSQHWHIFYDHFWKINPQHQLDLGISYDHLTAEARKRDVGSSVTTPSGAQNFPTPNQIWRMHYGDTAKGKQRTDGVGGALKYTFKPTALSSYQLALDSLIRQPHNAERYTALIGNNGAGWIGNPFLKPERHNRAALNFKWQGEGWRDYGKVKGGDVAGAWQVELHGFYDRVTDFITLDRARGQQGVVARNGNTISRNVDANLMGVELQLAKNLTNNLATRAKVRYQYGENRTDDRPLYNVRPLSLDVALDWKDYTSFGSYNLGASLHYSHKHNRLDDDNTSGFGFDNPLHYQSYAVVNLYGGVQLRDRIAFTAGIDNLFNRQYYAFNEQPHVAALKPTAVAAPERTYWVGINFNF